MKRIIIGLLAICFSETNVNAQYCGCFTDTNAPLNYLHGSGKITAAIDFNLINLSQGTIINPETGKDVRFNFANTPAIKPTCKNVYLISVYDETDRRYIHEQHSETLTQFSYAFPRADRAYTVTFKVTGVSRNPVDPGLTRDQVCYRESSVVVRPKPRQCDCVAENGINSIVVTGSISSTAGSFSGQNNYAVNAFFYNKSKCELKVESITLQDGSLSPAMAIGLGGNSQYQGVLSTNKPVIPKVESKFKSANINVKYSLNGKVCTQSFTMQFFDKK